MWIKWALGEACFRALSMALIKVIGGIAQTFGNLLLSTLIIGVVQTISAGSVLSIKKIHPLPGARLVLGSVLFGIGAFLNTVIAFAAYMHGANIAVYTLLTLLSIVPGAIIDRLWFGERIELRHILGIGLAVIAGWFALNTPDVNEVTELPLWVLLGLANAIGLAANQGVSRWVKDVDSWVKNFWGGCTTFVLCAAVLVLSGSWADAFDQNAGQIVFWSVIIAFVVIGIWSFNVIAYRDGAAIPTKHIVVSAAFMGLVMATGVVVFHESVFLAQIVGVGLFVAAFTLMHEDSWKYITRKR